MPINEVEEIPTRLLLVAEIDRSFHLPSACACSCAGFHGASVYYLAKVTPKGSRAPQESSMKIACITINPFGVMVTLAPLVPASRL